MRGKKISPIVWLAALMFFCGTVAGAAAATSAEGSKKPEQRAEQKAEPVKPTADLTVSVLSNYISKGDELSRNSIVIQPEVFLGYKGLSLAIWGNLDTRPYLSETCTYKGDKRQNWTETDVTLAYNRSFGIVNAGVAYAYFGNAAFWNSDVTGAGPDMKDDQEVSLTLGLNTILAPKLKVGRSFDSTQIWYMSLGVSHTFPINEYLGLTLAATGSYLVSQDENRLKINGNGTDRKPDGSLNDRYNNFHDAVISLSLPVKPTAYLTVTPQISYIFPMVDDAKYDMMFRSMQCDTTFADRQNSYLVGGMSVTLSF